MSHIKISQPKSIPTYIQTLQVKVSELDQIEKESSAYIDNAAELVDGLEEGGLFRFKQEYGKVLAVLKHTMQNSIKLKEKYNDAVQELQQVDSTAIDVSKLSHDQATLKTLKNQITRAETLLLASNKREEGIRTDIRQLKYDINNLSTTIKQGVGLSSAQERTINDLIQSKETCTKELESELEKIVSLRNGLTQISEKIESTESDCKHLEKEIVQLKEKNSQKKLEIDMELKNKEKLERDLRELRVVVTIKSQEAVAKQGSVNRATEEIAMIENQIKQQKSMMEKLMKDQESLGTRTVKLQQDYDEQMILTNQLMADNQEAMVELRVKERELNSHRAEVSRVNKIKDLLVNKSRILEDLKQQAENERKVYREKNEQYLKEIDKASRTMEGVKKTIDDLSREKDILETSLKKTVLETGKVHTIILLQKQQQATMQLEIARLIREKAENMKLEKVIGAELDRYNHDSQNLHNQIQNLIRELKEKELKIFEYKKTTQQSENKLKFQQNLYEQVQSDRKLHAKQLVDSQAQIAEMKRKLKIMNFQINGFKDDVNSKEAQLLRESQDLVKLKKDSELIQEELKTLKNQNELASAYIKTQMVEEYKLDSFVKEAETEKQRQQAQLDLIVAERDSLNHQLLRRNQELTKVYDNIKTQALELSRGESHYASKLVKIRQLRLEIVETKKKISDLQSETVQIPGMKRTMLTLQNQIMDSQTRIKALEEELEYPVNVHRWRTLEGSNPQHFEMITLLQSLQKQLIQKTKEEQEKTDTIQIKERLYLHLKSLLAKQAGPEQKEQLVEYKKLLKEKAHQLKHMDTELNMYKAQCDEYKYEIQKLDQELAQVKARMVKAYKEQVHMKEYDIKDLPALPEKFKSISETGSISNGRNSAVPESNVGESNMSSKDQMEDLVESQEIVNE